MFPGNFKVSILSFKDLTDFVVVGGEFRTTSSGPFGTSTMFPRLYAMNV